MTQSSKPSNLNAYSADLKLSTVLEYVRNPKRKKQICQEKEISELLLDQWYQEFVQRAKQVFPDSELSIPPKTKRKRNNLAEELQRDDSSPWGFRVNSERGCYLSRSTSAQPPQWLSRLYRNEWNKRGLIIWDRSAQRMEQYPASRALKLLSQVRSTRDWRTDGFRIIRCKLVDDYRPDETGKVSPKPKMIQEELFHLAPAVASELDEFLQEQKVFLEVMAEEDDRGIKRGQEQAFSILLQAYRKAEADEVKLQSRSLHWTRHAESATLVCDDPPNRGTVTLSDDGWLWQVCIERPGRLKQWNSPLMQIEDALTWAEYELLAARAQSARTDVDALQTSSTKSVDPSPKIDLTPYRIDPANLDPEHITYRAIVEVEHIPTKYETIELSFGESIRFAEHYPSPSQLAREVNIDLTQVKMNS